MRPTRRDVLVFACSLSAGCSEKRAPDPAPTITKELETSPDPEFWLGVAAGKHRATRVEPSIPTELGPVQRRFAEAAAKNQAWLQSYLAELALPAGAPLPYHPNLGVTADEHRRLLEAYEHPVMLERERFDIDIDIERGSALRMQLPSSLAAATTLSIDRGGRLTYGPIVVEAPERVSDLKGKFGVWSGFAWRRDADRAAATAAVDVDSLDVNFGRIAASRQLFLYLSRFHASSGAVLERDDLLAWVEG